MDSPGLQPERTELAWRRTGIAETVTALALARIAAAHDEPLAAVGALLAVVLGLASFVASHQRYHRRAGAFQHGRALRLPAMAVYGVLGTVLTGVVGLALVLWR
jgi:uncharacterized membrane protein YidH (DUF202 family)